MRFCALQVSKQTVSDNYPKDEIINEEVEVASQNLMIAAENLKLCCQVSVVFIVTNLHQYVVFISTFSYFCTGMGTVFIFFVFSCIFILQSRESDQSVMTNLLKSCRPPVYHTKMGESC